MELFFILLVIILPFFGLIVGFMLGYAEGEKEVLNDCRCEHCLKKLNK